jgi:mRNA interferase MazF
VLSPEAYNRRTSLFLACPVRSQVKGYPFEVALPAGLPVSGVILADQIKSLDWQKRKAQFAGRTKGQVINEVIALILPLIGEEG